MSIFTKVGAWLGKAVQNVGTAIADVFKFVETTADKVAISVTEGVKTALVNGTLGFIADIADGLTKSQVPTEIVTLISNNIDKLLAVELAIQGLPANPTAADVLAFEQSVLKAFGVVSNTSKLYTTLAAQIYGIIQTEINKNTSLTFAELVADVEEAYQDYVQDSQTTAS